MTVFERLQTLMSAWLTFPGGDIVLSIIYIILVALCAVAGYYATIWILKGVAFFVEKSETTWDDDLINDKLLKALSQLSPAVIVAVLLPQGLSSGLWFFGSVRLLTYFYIIWVTVYAINTFLDNLLQAFSLRPKFKAYAVKGIFQMGKLVTISVGIIIAISLMVERSPIAIVTTLGASAAILMLVFKDTILGLVASVQLTANSMVQKGDWVVVPRHNANGEVIDISLTTVKIRNWDNSVTTVPPYSLVSDSFQNFQAMRRSKARRICRAIYVDFNSIRYLKTSEIASLKEAGLLPVPPTPVGGTSAGKKSTKKPSKNQDVALKHEDAKGLMSEYNPERMVNLSLFRHYLEQWLAAKSYVRSDLLLMVRQMNPVPEGLPLEIYCFVNTTEWKAYERLQSDIFDEIFALAPHFDITIFQSPSGRDVAAIGKETK
ncbi:MAG: mechanosensitive ion channel family protein [Muribaculaceae bacterium]|nr:mechanosensitive ion channel family protein [Muribaculaceae bacterium]